MKYLKFVAFVAIFIFAGMKLFSGGPISRPPGQLAPEIPKQTTIENGSELIVGDFHLVPRARYVIEARVLSVEPYIADAGAKLSPIDFAVGWGPMSDSAVIEHFRIRQGGRFFSIYPDEKALDLTTAMRSASNMHLIPADGAIRATLEKTRPGNIVTLEGFLVTASRSDGFTWNTSLTRDDTGNGACELMYVKSVALR